MKIKRNQAISAVAVVILLILGYIFFSRKASGEMVIVGKDGLVRKEKYVSGVEECLRKDAPTWCGDEYSVAYSSGAAGIDDMSFFSGETGMCSDGTKNCLYTERFNSERILQGIFNESGEELGQKFLDDLYSGRITFSSEMIEKFKTKAKFENGVLKLQGWEGDTEWLTVKVGIVTDEQKQQEYSQGIIRVPLSQFILTLGVYFKANNLPKPTLNYQLQSPLTAAQYRAALPAEESRPIPR